ncbi:4-amino-4-deoxychorismate lyase [Spirosomataceae bacterium TFI 002]|nr:4-amino-4-deoxychorismate lyase [Spirosomataceae bacterium TFI 002]
MPLLEWHEKRFRETSALLYAIQRRKTLAQYFDQLAMPTKGLYKVRVVYSKSKVKVEWAKYTLSKHQTVELRTDNEISYPTKNENRLLLNQHKAATNADDFIIVQHGKLTDAWYSNIALLKNGKWYTPSTPLLNGVKRKSLITTDSLEVKEIKAVDISTYEQIAFINAMRDFEKKYNFRVEGNMLYLTEVPQ